MKAISLWQPWASLIAVEAKRIETRHWRAPGRLLGERIAIHAAKTTQHLVVCGEPPFSKYVEDQRALPLGAVVATAVLDRCAAITAESAAELARRRPDEACFGLYTTGRFAWIMRDVEPLAEPVPFKGRQGFFDVPDEMLGIELAVPGAPTEASR